MSVIRGKSLPPSWDTKSNPVKSQSDIMAVLSRFGCGDYGFRSHPDGCISVSFVHRNVPIEIKVDSGILVKRAKACGVGTRMGEPEIRAKATACAWRNLHDTLKVMLNQTENGLFDFKTLMLPFIRVGGQVIADRLLNNIDDILSGKIALPAAPTDPFDLLKIPHDAKVRDIESAHARLAMQYHPDKGGSGEMMALINDARDKALKIVRQKELGDVRD
jgi:hypothetical protein